MFLFSNKFYLIFVSIWIIGLYFIWTTFNLTFNNDKTSEQRIEYLQNEIESLQQRILQIQSQDNDQLPSFSRCKELSDELKRVKLQLKENNNSKTTPQRM
jgi:hypothetical protein